MKKDNKNKKDLNEVARIISTNMETNLAKVQEVLGLELEDILTIINGLKDTERDEVCNIMINTELEKLKTLSMKQFESVSREIDEITDYYVIKRKDFDVVIEEGDKVANDILFKLIGKNGRKLSLPIDISIIKEYCFSAELKEEQFYETLVWIILRYVAISKCLSLKEWQEKYKEEKMFDN
jgi:hypothetical protein